ncbi:ABC transporter ATP-binding protein [Tunicatimonas pelagia]|uniref:ABC transporter ATP-binding protein n=1 Tax=Tunicatimonas pelagia TaxID=931531 RepID=UPI002665140B|nr:ABC transporter ATP-binding protein [Tunicatimonas pelagia]WKN40723.1 ABC transporter ATP-binding protein [Tunicatimonas pelagia]
MSDVAISVDNISKRYLIGDTSSGSLRETIADFFSNQGSQKTEEFWALKDISFEVKRGEAIGIIGKNGAGKSTLLKVLSRITEPTTGRIEIDGRVSSLLEVGTGFHPELTGRENVFLNGTILGMSRDEIKAKFDEIVDFSGVEKFLDTPVKRYSSGMTVRLAFAVAAHLEPEILIIDEVLAVGDAEFQSKCLGKMKDVAGQGRTVLFVSHNMGAVKSLCQTGVFLKNGRIELHEDAIRTVDYYLENAVELKGVFSFKIPKINDMTLAYATELTIEDENETVTPVVFTGYPWNIRVKFTIVEKIPAFIIGIGIVTIDNVSVRTTWSNPQDISPGEYEAIFREDMLYFSSGVFKLNLGLSSRERNLQYLNECAYVEFEEQIDKQVALNTKSGILLNPMGISIFQISEA